MELKDWIRLSVTMLLLGVIFYFYIDISELSKIIAEVSIVYYFGAVIVSICSILISVHRWQIILRYHSANLSYWSLTKIYMVSIFYNLTLPGSLGGDAVKMYRISQLGEDKGKLIGSVPLERISGLIALFPVILIGFAYSYHILPQWVMSVAIITGVFILIVIFGLTSEIFRKWMIWIVNQPLLGRFNLTVHIRSMIAAIRALRKPKFIFLIVGYSIIYVIFTLFVNYLYILSIGSEISFLYLAAVIPIQQILKQIPISIGGIGINEGVLVFFLGIVGISPEVAVVVSILDYITQLINSIIGGIIDLDI